jgi:hypothetical protein
MPAAPLGLSRSRRIKQGRDFARVKQTLLHHLALLQRLRASHQVVACGSADIAGRLAQKQFRPKFLLELLDAARHRGRVDPQASPRPGEATASSHGEEVAQVVPMHKLNFANPFGKTDYGSLDSLGLPQ